VLSGHLGFQIEHHLFPNIPAGRYPEIAPRVREICEAHGALYSTGSLASQFASAMRRLVRFAVPGRAEQSQLLLTFLRLAVRAVRAARAGAAVRHSSRARPEVRALHSRKRERETA
jgi:hypothetical protein